MIFGELGRGMAGGTVLSLFNQIPELFTIGESGIGTGGQKNFRVSDVLGAVLIVRLSAQFCVEDFSPAR